MEKQADEMQTKYLETAAPVLQHMHAAIGPMIQADDTLLDHFDARKMMIKVLADSAETAALYECGLITDAGYEHCMKAVKEMKEAGLTAFVENGKRIVVEPTALKVANFLKGKNEYVPFEPCDVDYALMMQGAAQLFEMLHYNRFAFETDLSKELPQKTWHLGADKDQTAYMLLFHLTALNHGLKRVLPAQATLRKTQILLETLIVHFFQCASYTLYKEGEKRCARLQKSGADFENASQSAPRHLSAVRQIVGLKKGERMMAMGYIFEKFSGARLAYSSHRQTMLLSGLVHAMREEIERADFSKLFQKDNPNKRKLGIYRQKQVLHWYDAHTAPFLSTVPQHVRTGVNKALRNLGRPSNERS